MPRNFQLAGLIYLAAGKGPHPTVVLLHGLPGNEKNLDIAQLLRRAGFNVMFFHYRGAWGAQGEYSLAQVDDDALAALAYLRDPAQAGRYRVDTGKFSLLGHSLGGYASLAAGQQDKYAVCVGAMSPANLAVIAAGISGGEEGMLAFLQYADTLFMLEGFDGEAMKAQLASVPLESLDTRTFGPGLRGKSVFMIVGEQDVVTPAALMFDPVVAAYTGDGKIALEAHKIPGDHSFSASRISLSKRVLDWLQRDCR